MDDTAHGNAELYATSVEGLRALTWLRDEVGRSLEAAQKAQQRYLREAEALRGSDLDDVDPAVLHAARSHLHQTAGALELAGLTVPATLVQAGERALQRFIDRSATLDAAANQTLERAWFALGDYLDRLRTGKPVSGVSLFPQYRALAELAGADRIHPADLWEHDWRWRTIGAGDAVPSGPDEPAARELMERLILRLMRTPDRTTLRRMSDLCASLGAQAQGRRATMWHLAAGFFEAQAAGLLRQDVYVKRAAPRLLAQARLGMRSGEVSDRLARDLLFFCAQAIAPADAAELPRLRAVHQAYDLLPGSVPDYEVPSLGRFDPAWIAVARKRVAGAREAWAAAAGGDPLRRSALAEPFALLRDSLERLFPRGDDLGQALTRAVQSAGMSRDIPPALAMEVATAVLCLEAALEEGSLDEPGLAERMQQLAERIEKARTGGEPAPLEPWMEALYRRVADSQTMASVVQQLRGMLAEIEQALDRHCRAPDGPQELEPVASGLASIRGVLVVLGVEAAAQAVQCAREDVQQLAALEAGQPPGTLLERLAANLEALGFLLDILAVQPDLARSMFRFDGQQGLLCAAPTPAGVPRVQGRLPGEAFGDSLPERLQRLARDATRDDVADDAIVAELRALAPQALMAEERRLAETLGSALSRLERGANDERRAARASLAMLSPTKEPAGTGTTAVAAQAATPEAGPAPAGGPSAVGSGGTGAADATAAPAADADTQDMRAVFLEECADVITQARSAIVRMAQPDRDQAEDLSDLTLVRRAFHTLKGSSRMVGLSAFGQAAWACEQLYNARLAQASSLDPDLRRFTLQALAYLQGWTEAIRAGEERGHAAAPVVEAADAMRLEARFLPLPLPTLEAVLEEAPGSLPAPTDDAGVAARAVPVQEAGQQAVPDAALHALPPGAEPAPAAAAMTEVPAPGPREGPAALDEPVKVIGPLRVDIAVFNVFLNEADELSRQLSMQLAEWATEPLGPPGEGPVSLAHSLAGSSATVGFEDLAVLARALEQALVRGNDSPSLQPDETALYTQVADDIRRMLHQFAAGFLVPPRDDLLSRLEDHRRTPARRVHEPPREAVLLADEDDIDLEDAVDDALFPVFGEEAGEHLPQLQASMRRWVELPADRAAAAACLRTLHTFKGAARLAGAMRLGERAHRLETAIERLLSSEAITAADVEPLVWRVDALEAAFHALQDTVQAAGLVPPPSPALTVPAAPPGEQPVPASIPEPAGEPALAAPGAVESLGIDWSRFPPAGPAAGPAASASIAAAVGAVRVKSTLLDRLVNHAGEVSIARTRIEADLAQIKASLGDLADNLERLRAQLRDVEVQAESQIGSRLEAAKAAAIEFDPLEMDRYTRMQEVTRMMAESVADVAAVQRSLQRALQSGEDQVALQGRLARALQDDLMRTRMVEFDSLSDRLYRVLRQTAKETGRQVRLDIVGGSIEIDRGVLERMTAPFEHLLRNSIVHGIEPPAQRLAAGKDATGLVRIQLAPEGNEVAIDFSDDGAGLDLPRIRALARSVGLLAPDAELSDDAVAGLIFAPGFSTADRVTEIAGRGIGMDVVRSEVLALGGRIQTRSVAGQGASFRLILPLTTAVTQVVMLRCGPLTVAVPSNLVESVRREPAAVVDEAYREGIWRAGSESLPFHWLGALLGGEVAGAASGQRARVVIVRSAAQRVAIHVDEVLGHQEVVVKNLGPQLARLPGLAGITLLASGAIAPIYNPVALAAWYGAAARRRVERLLAGHGIGGALVGEAPAPPPLPLVLVVDDSLTVRRVTQRLLGREGYRVATAKDGLEALERIAQERPDLVLSDIEMPRMDGFEFVRRLRADPALAALPVVVITSRIAQKHRDYARELGIEHYLGKPYGEEELLSLVARLARKADSAT